MTIDMSPDIVARVRSLYEDHRMTLVEVAEAIGTSKRTVLRMMQRHGIDRRSCAKRDQRGEKNPRWKGSGAGYNACHFRVEQARGKPAECVACGVNDPTRRYEWANLSGRYDEVADYIRLCVSCHRRLDSARPIAKRSAA